MRKFLSSGLLDLAILGLSFVGVPRLLEYAPYTRVLDATLSLGLSFEQIALLMASISAVCIVILSVSRRLGWLWCIPLSAIAIHVGIAAAVGGAFSELDANYDLVGRSDAAVVGAFVGYLVTTRIGAWLWFFGSIGKRRNGRISSVRTLFQAGTARIFARKRSRLGRTPSRASEDPNPQRRIANYTHNARRHRRRTEADALRRDTRPRPGE